MVLQWLFYKINLIKHKNNLLWCIINIYDAPQNIASDRKKLGYMKSPTLLDCLKQNFTKGSLVILVIIICRFIYQSLSNYAGQHYVPTWIIWFFKPGLPDWHLSWGIILFTIGLFMLTVIEYTYRIISKKYE